MKQSALTTKALQITRKGPKRASRRAIRNTARMDSVAAVITTLGKSATSNCDKKIASRVALPAT